MPGRRRRKHQTLDQSRERDLHQTCRSDSGESTPSEILIMRLTAWQPRITHTDLEHGLGHNHSSHRVAHISRTPQERGTHSGNHAALGCTECKPGFRVCGSGCKSPPHGHPPGGVQTAHSAHVDGGDGEICPPNLPHLPGLKPQVGVLPRVEVRLPARQLPCLEPGCGLHTVWTVTMYMVQSLFMTPCDVNVLCMALWFVHSSPKTKTGVWPPAGQLSRLQPGVACTVITLQ